MKTTRTQLDIVKLLLSEGNYSIRKIAKILSKSYTLTYNSIQKLIAAKIVEKQSIPPAHIIRLHNQAQISILVNAELSKYDEFAQRHPWIALYKKDVLHAVQAPFFILLIFGSYAKGAETKRSDLDLLCIVPVKNDISQFERALQQYTKVKKSIIVVDLTSFRDMTKNPNELSVGIEARKCHVILHGAEIFHAL